jgi:NADPH:quinone reductase-like Zn-dependent oxidoreductase
MQWMNGGAWAEYATAPECGMAIKPAKVSFEAAAAVPTAGLIALMNLRQQGGLKAGHEVLINGAGGGVGTLALQLASGLGATVTAVDKGEKLEALLELGAAAVIDYEKEDFTEGSARYDLIFDIPGKHSFAQCRKALKPSGIWVIIVHDNYGKGMNKIAGLIPRMMGLMLRGLFDSNLPKSGFAMPDKVIEMELLREFLQSGKLTPRIDRSFKLDEAEEAMRYLESGQAKGRIVIKI